MGKVERNGRNTLSILIKMLILQSGERSIGSAAAWFLLAFFVSRGMRSTCRRCRLKKNKIDYVVVAESSSSFFVQREDSFHAQCCHP
jgi:hypothetical protein